MRSDPRFIFTGHGCLQPRLMTEIPFDCLANAASEIFPRLPSEFSTTLMMSLFELDTTAQDKIAANEAGTAGDENAIFQHRVGFAYFCTGSRKQGLAHR